MELVASDGRTVHGYRVAPGVMVDNAVEPGQAQGRIALVLRPGALAVLGDGPLVDAATLARLADRFYRVAGHAAQGSGPGLSIVDKIARAQGGRLQSGPGLDGNGFGATVFFCEELYV